MNGCERGNCCGTCFYTGVDSGTSSGEMRATWLLAGLVDEKLRAYGRHWDQTIEWWAVLGHNLAVAGFGQAMWEQCTIAMLSSGVPWVPNVSGRAMR